MASTYATRMLLFAVECKRLHVGVYYYQAVITNICFKYSYRSECSCTANWHQLQP